MDPGTATGDGPLLALARSPQVKAFLAMPRTCCYVCRRNGDILWASGNFAQVLGYSPEHLVGRNAWEILPAPEGLADAARSSALLSEGDLAVWLLLVKADGSRDWFRVDALNREGGCILAFRREVDPARRHFHYLALPRTGP